MNNKTRRHFFKSSALALAGMSVGGLLSSCAAFDDFLFDDNNNFDDQVAIIGGGIAGLYLAHKLRAKQLEFRLFEAGSVFGGRIKSAQKRDYGASIISNKHELVSALVSELKLNKSSLDKENFFLDDGMQSMIDSLLERSIGLIPYRNFRLRWQLVEVQRLSSSYKLIFQHPDGQKAVTCQRVALAIPPSQWAGIKGLLELPEMQTAKQWLDSVKNESAIRLLLPSSSLPNTAKPLEFNATDNFNVRQILKKNKNNTSAAELDVLFQSDVRFSIDFVYTDLKKKLQINYPFNKMTSDQFYNWQQAKFIQAAYFKSDKKLVNNSQSPFQILGDFLDDPFQHTIEASMRSAAAAANIFI